MGVFDYFVKGEINMCLLEWLLCYVFKLGEMLE